MSEITQKEDAEFCRKDLEAADFLVSFVKNHNFDNSFLIICVD